MVLYDNIVVLYDNEATSTPSNAREQMETSPAHLAMRNKTKYNVNIMYLSTFILFFLFFNLHFLFFVIICLLYCYYTCIDYYIVILTT